MINIKSGNVFVGRDMTWSRKQNPGYTILLTNVHYMLYILSFILNLSAFDFNAIVIYLLFVCNKYLYLCDTNLVLK